MAIPKTKLTDDTAPLLSKFQARSMQSACAAGGTALLLSFLESANSLQAAGCLMRKPPKLVLT